MDNVYVKYSPPIPPKKSVLLKNTILCDSIANGNIVQHKRHEVKRGTLENSIKLTKIPLDATEFSSIDYCCIALQGVLFYIGGSLTLIMIHDQISLQHIYKRRKNYTYLNSAPKMPYISGHK